MGHVDEYDPTARKFIRRNFTCEHLYSDIRSCLSQPAHHRGSCLECTASALARLLPGGSLEDAHALLAHPPGGKSKSAQHKRQLIRQAENSARAKCNPADPGKLKDYDIWTFGPPCTPFSSVRNKRGDQPRNSSWRKHPDSILTFETIPELLREAYPRVALIEQVGGFGQALDGPFHPTPLSSFVCILQQIYPGVEVAKMHLSDWADATRLRLELLKFGMSKYMLHIAIQISSSFANS
jgi:site-specific DNA-cytosine methylase